MTLRNEALLSEITADRFASYLKARDLPVPPDQNKMVDLVLNSSGAKSQADVAALIITLTDGQIAPLALTGLLKACCPNDKVGDRHGPHYLCLARTGKLKGTTVVPPRAGRAASKPTAETTQTIRVLQFTDPRVAELEAQLAEIQARVAAALTQTSAAKIKAALAQAPAETTNEE